MVELDAQVMKQSLEEVNTQLALITSIYEKQSALWDKKIGSEIQYLQAKNNKESLEKRVNTMKEQLNWRKLFRQSAVLSKAFRYVLDRWPLRGHLHLQFALSI